MALVFLPQCTGDRQEDVRSKHWPKRFHKRRVKGQPGYHVGSHFSALCQVDILAVTHFDAAQATREAGSRWGPPWAELRAVFP